MPDAFLEWNGDFVASPSGGLLLASGDDFARQRIIRRLLTAVNGYIFHLDYGAGLPQKIGSPAFLPTLKSLIRSQIALESSVAPTPAPIIAVTQDKNNLGLYTISIKYTAAASGSPVTLSFTL